MSDFQSVLTADDMAGLTPHSCRQLQEFERFLHTHARECAVVRDGVFTCLEREVKQYFPTCNEPEQILIALSVVRMLGISLEQYIMGSRA